MLFRQHVLKLDEEIVELVFEWQSASRIIVSQTELAQYAWVAYLHRADGRLFTVTHFTPFSEFLTNVPSIELPGS